MDTLDQYFWARVRTVRRVGIMRQRCRKYLSSPRAVPSRAEHDAPLKGEYGAGEFAFLGEGFHHGGKNHNFHAEGGDGGGLGFVGGVDDEGASEVGVEFGDTEGGRIVTELGEHFIGGAFEGLAADDRTDGENFSFVSAQLVADLRDGENRADTDQRIAGADEDAIGVANGFEDAGSWRC